MSSNRSAKAIVSGDVLTPQRYASDMAYNMKRWCWLESHGAVTSDILARRAQLTSPFPGVDHGFGGLTKRFFAIVP